jgi:hypothetical protein
MATKAINMPRDKVIDWNTGDPVTVVRIEIVRETDRQRPAGPSVGVNTKTLRTQDVASRNQHLLGRSSKIRGRVHLTRLADRAPTAAQSLQHTKPAPPN